MPSIPQFVDSLSKIPKSGHAFNPYYGPSPESAIRKHNLAVYLNKMQQLRPSLLLMGEAPGYKGCRLTGIPFSSEKILHKHPFFQEDSLQFIHPADQLESENSATMVWEQLMKFDQLPLIWNSFPFHPHQVNNPQSNRKPDAAELQEGKTILLELLEIFPIRKIIALGRSAEAQLAEIGIPFVYVRHPSYGGKAAFVAGLRKERNGGNC